MEGSYSSGIRPEARDNPMDAHMSCISELDLASFTQVILFSYPMHLYVSNIGYASVHRELIKYGI